MPRLKADVLAAVSWLSSVETEGVSAEVCEKTFSNIKRLIRQNCFIEFTIELIAPIIV